MSREYRFFLDDMRNACEKAIRYSRNLSREQFVADEKTFDAVMRDLEIIGEAAKHIPADARARSIPISVGTRLLVYGMWSPMSISGLILRSSGTL